MNYIQILRIFQGVENADRDAYMKLQVAKAVINNIDTYAYDEEGFNEVCERIFDYWWKNVNAISLPSFCAGIQEALDEAEDGNQFVNAYTMKKGWKYGLALEGK